MRSSSGNLKAVWEFIDTLAAKGMFEPERISTLRRLLRRADRSLRRGDTKEAAKAINAIARNFLRAH